MHYDIILCNSLADVHTQTHHPPQVAGIIVAIMWKFFRLHTGVLDVKQISLCAIKYMYFKGFKGTLWTQKCKQSSCVYFISLVQTSLLFHALELRELRRK